MSTHDTTRVLSDDQVALLYGIELEAVPNFRRKALLEAVKADGHRRAMGLLLERPGVHHKYTDAEDELICSPEFTDRFIGSILGVSGPAVQQHRRRLLRGNGRAAEWFADLQEATRAQATNHGGDWSPADEQELEEYGGNLKYLAFKMGRTYIAVVSHRAKMRARERAPEYEGVTE